MVSVPAREYFPIALRLAKTSPSVLRIPTPMTLFLRLSRSLALRPALVLGLLLTGCAAPGTATKRVASVIELRPEKEALYRKLHAEPTPEVLEVMRAANLRNFSIYLREIDGRKLLFAYFEYHGRDFKGDMAKLGASPVTKDWHKLTDPCQRPVPGAARGEWWSGMEEVFHMP